MADETHSTDVVGSPQAAAFDPAIPGRAVAKMGPGRLTSFQTAFVGGWTDESAPPPAIRVETLTFGAPLVWESPTPPVAVDAIRDPGPNDLHRLVDTARAAASLAGIATPRRPWQRALAEVYDLARAPQSRTDSNLVFGIADQPDEQRQAPVAFVPDRDGNMAVFGTGASGKSTFLRTLAAVAGLSTRGGPCQVYGLDFGARGLDMLEDLPHVGSIIGADDEERTVRLLRWLRELVEERGGRYAAVRAGTITEYRQLAGRPDEPRILLLLDGFAAFRQAYEVGLRSRWYDALGAIAAEGRPVGVHVAVSADRQAALPSGFASVVQRRLVLRLASAIEYSMFNVPQDAFGPATPPGRGFVDGYEVQVMVHGGSANTASQAHAIARLAADLRRKGAWPPAPPIARLPERVPLGDLPVEVNGQPALGLADDTFAPVGFVADEALLVLGPAHSGRSSLLASLALSVARARPGTPLLHLAPRRSGLGTLVPWTESAQGVDEAAVLAKAAKDQIDNLRPGAPRPAIFVEELVGFLSSPADLALVELVKSCRAAGCLVVGEGETTSVASSLQLLQAFKSNRHGVVLTPNQVDGEILKTPLPRVTRAEFPPGRGFYVRHGRALRVQCALPELDAS